MTAFLFAVCVKFQVLLRGQLGIALSHKTVYKLFYEKPAINICDSVLALSAGQYFLATYREIGGMILISGIVALISILKGLAMRFIVTATKKKISLKGLN